MDLIHCLTSVRVYPPPVRRQMSGGAKTFGLPLTVSDSS
jgi:hypothetical protein